MIMPLVSLAATIAATGGLHTYLNEHEEGHGPRVAVDYDLEEVERDSTTEPVGPGSPETATTQLPGDILIESSVDIVVPAGQYARLFDEDPAAAEVDIDTADEISQAITGLQQNGFTVRVSLRGNASAEDNTTDGMAGITAQSEKNVSLANKRRDSLLEYLQAKNAIPDDVEIELMEGSEQQATSQDIAVVTGLAEQFGYQSPEAMIRAWNDNPDSIPPLAAEALSSFLGDSRNVMVQIFGEKQIDGEPETVESVVCVVPVEEITTITSEPSEPFRVTIPWIVPIIIPRLRRRKQNTGELIQGDYVDPISEWEKKLVESAPKFKDSLRELREVIRWSLSRKKASGGENATIMGEISSEQTDVAQGVGDTPKATTTEASTEHSQKNDQEPSPDISEEKDKKSRKRRIALMILGGLAAVTAMVSLGILQNNDETPATDKSDPELVNPNCDPQLPVVEEVVKESTRHVIVKND